MLINVTFCIELATLLSPLTAGRQSKKRSNAQAGRYNKDAEAKCKEQMRPCADYWNARRSLRAVI